ncbi:unnamed protein product, partial [Symbiodinium necroappetens]
GWTARHDAEVRAACEREGVPMPSRLTGEDTVRGAVRDYTLRTFTTNDAPEPPPPPGIRVLCCHHVAAVNGANGVDFVRLPHRAMQWAPVPIRHAAGIAAWQPSWLCPGCAQEVRLADLDVPADAGQPCSRCGRALRWEYDRATGRGQLSCMPGCAGSARPAAPQEPRGTLTTPHQAAACLPASRGAFWLSRGPPIGHVQEATNSWLYVPLLHAAAADLTSSAVEAWRADPRAADWWDPARRLLATSSPVAPHVLADAVRHATEAAPSHAHHLPDLLGRLERRYLIATVQEALLQCYGGAAFALAVDRQSDRSRQRPRSPPSRDASQPPATPAAVPDARNGYDAAELTRHGCERRDALAARPRLPRRRRGARGSGAAALQPGQPAPEEDHAASASDGADIATAAPPANSAGTSVALTRAAGSWLDGSDLSAEFRNPVPTLQTVPRFLITGVRRALVAALSAIRAAHESRDEAERVRAWKLFLLLPRLLLARSAQTGADGRAALMRRIELFRQGRFDELHAQSAAEHEQAHPRRRGGDNEEARAAAACAKVRRGQLSRARQMLTAAALAPGNAATLEALTDTAWRPPHALRSPAPEVLQYRPSEEVVRTAHQVGEALRTSKRGSAAGLSGATVELYKLLLDDAEALESFTFAVNVTARAHAPQAALDAIAVR